MAAPPGFKTTSLLPLPRSIGYGSIRGRCCPSPRTLKETTMLPSNALYKVLDVDGSTFHGGSGKWFLPRKNVPGKWMPKIRGELVPCQRGYHVLKAEMLVKWLGPAIFSVEGRGAEVWQADKGV